MLTEGKLFVISENRIDTFLKIDLFNSQVNTVNGRSH